MRADRLPALPTLRWDLFCQVIDNHGDLGVCWRLARDLVRHGQRVRLWVDDASALAWMAPGVRVGTAVDAHAALQVLPWTAGQDGAPAALQLPCPDSADVLVEAFGCEPPDAMVAAYAAAPHAVAWINLEYLSAEAFVARQHALPSPVMHGPGHGLTKHFFFPGFEAGTGGLIREAHLSDRQRAFDAVAWRARHGVQAGERVASVFCYEPLALPGLLHQLATGDAAPDASHGSGQGTTPWRLMVTPGRAAAATRSALTALDTQHPGWNSAGRVRITWLDAMPQDAFDELLWACDLNFVRGEDSLVRAIWARRPFVWQLYPQHDGAHHAKLQAFAALLRDADAPPALLQWLSAWNADAPAQSASATTSPAPAVAAQQAQTALPARTALPGLSDAALAEGALAVQRLADRMAALGPLTERLVHFAASHPARPAGSHPKSR